jgi:hypothetical protein
MDQNFSSIVQINSGIGDFTYFFDNFSSYSLRKWSIVCHGIFSATSYTTPKLFVCKNSLYENHKNPKLSITNIIAMADFSTTKYFYPTTLCNVLLTSSAEKLRFEIQNVDNNIDSGFFGYAHIQLKYKY